MRRLLKRAALALVLVGAGWAFARAQTDTPSFELTVDVSVDGGASGATITCVNGCTLAWVERGVNPNSRPTSTFTFGCNNASGTPAACASGRIGGWLR